MKPTLVDASDVGWMAPSAWILREVAECFLPCLDYFLSRYVPSFVPVVLPLLFWPLSRFLFIYVFLSVFPSFCYE